MVKGCPCYKEFGIEEKEKVCLNNDDVLPIRAISVDPSFFEQINTIEELLEHKSNNENMCYLLIYLDRNEGYCYCVSQGKRIRINDKDVKSSEVDSALQFVTSTEKSSDGIICSECLYKYLRTLGEASEGFLTDTERGEIVTTYVKEVSMKMAAEIVNYSVKGESISDYAKAMKRHIKRINSTRSQWAALTLKLKKSQADIALIELVDCYREFYRLEVIFLSQVLELENPPQEIDALEALRFMVGVSERVIQLSDLIREKTYDLMERNILSKDLQEKLHTHSEKRKRTEYRFSNLVRVLTEIDQHTV
ncbi:MAG: hypothetical protein JW779_04280 [Candidatus Thorarchaeota archaeon]|nr:hypothetical protein [Candidatus Thorarchaeota archaeon]